MTMQELYQLCDLKKEIRMDAMRLAELEASAMRITAAPSMLPSFCGDGKKLERDRLPRADVRGVIFLSARREVQVIFILADPVGRPFTRAVNYLSHNI